MLRYVDAVTDGAVTPAVTPLCVPAFNEHGVTLLTDADAVMLDSLYAYAVTLDALYVEGVSVHLGDGDVLGTAAAEAEQDGEDEDEHGGGTGTDQASAKELLLLRRQLREFRIFSHISKIVTSPLNSG